MCGICGIYNKDAKNTVQKRMLQLICDKMAHRGPDDEGYFLDRNLGLGHRRLSVIDIEGGHQPMSNEDETIWIVQNGEIYNYLELRTELIASGHKFKTHSDTEVIIHLYEDLGTECVNKLNGMFAFAIWDKKRRLLFCARDRFGIKPFYYYLDKDKFIFASEIKGILEARLFEKKPNFEAISDYLTFQFCLGDKTFFRGIKKLMPGHRMVVRDQMLKIEKYWELVFNIDGPERPVNDYAHRLAALLKDSIRIRLRSDVPVGAHLSGGLDSSTITCIASSLLSNSGFKTFTGGFREGEEFDESSFAKIISKYANTEYNEIFLRPKDFVESFSKLIFFLDEPAAGPGIFPQYFVSELASRKVKVVLGGQGGDEIFGGYIRYLILYLEECLKGAISDTQREARFVVTLDAIVKDMPYLKGYESLFQYFMRDGIFDSVDKRYFRLIEKCANPQDLISGNILEADSRYRPFEEFLVIFNQPNIGSLFNKMTSFDIKTLLPALLHVEDRTSMAVSLESRVPLLDHRIAELVASIPPTLKFYQGEPKYILKKAVKDNIPGEILERKDKMGFPVPLSDWYEKSLKGFVRDILLGQTTKKRGLFKLKGIEKVLKSERKYGRTIWGLLCLEAWFREFIDKP